MNYTKNHHLPQWVKDDRIMMDDFNQMCRDIESGIDAASGKADTAQAAANTANANANAAKSAASKAQSTANNALTSTPYYVGAYIGNGKDFSVTVGFRPSFVIVNGHKQSSGSDSTSKFGIYACMTRGTGTVGSCIQFNNTGFSVFKTSYFPDLTDKDRVYEYIAFK